MPVVFMPDFSTALFIRRSLAFKRAESQGNKAPGSVPLIAKYLFMWVWSLEDTGRVAALPPLPIKDILPFEKFSICKSRDSSRLKPAKAMRANQHLHSAFFAAAIIFSHSSTVQKCRGTGFGFATTIFLKGFFPDMS